MFGKLTTPYGRFEWQKTQILIAQQKERMDRTKKVRLAAKKVRPETRGYCTHIWEVDHPQWEV